MKRARVIGQVWAARKAAALDGRRLLLCADGRSGEVIVAIDTLDAGVGADVLVSWGSGARRVLGGGALGRGESYRDVLGDAAISLVVDDASHDVENAREERE
ncbi:MAG: hypothetical protein KC503_24365 [Myxococcales bacterium]|nr:hypothetical protein [Myxococcales bacterium]